MRPAPALLLIAHGTRNPRGAEEMDVLVHHLRRRVAAPVEPAWLEDFADPDAVAAAERLVAGGARPIVVLPFLALAAGHAKYDIPGEVDAVRAAFPQVAVTQGEVLGLHPALFRLAARRVAGAGEFPGEDEMLLVVGSGSSDPDANGDLAKAARVLAEQTGHRWVDVAYAGVTWPTADVALRRAHAAGARRVVRFSWSLLAGLLEQRVAAWAGDVADATGLAVVDAGRFGPDPLVADVVVERYAEAVARLDADADAEPADAGP